MVNFSCFSRICGEVGGEIPTSLTEDEFDAFHSSSPGHFASFMLNLAYDNLNQRVIERTSEQVVNQTFWRDDFHTEKFVTE